MHVKQVIVMRKDLKMRTGKMIAQGAHASMKVIMDMTVPSQKLRAQFTPDNIEWVTDKIRTLTMLDGSPLQAWLDGIFTKICVYVNSEEELDDVYDKARVARIPVALIVDNGKTEFKGIPTKTCCAIGPYWSSDIDKITGGLSLL